MRRALRIVVVGIGLLAVVAVGTYLWARTATDSSTVARAVVWLDSDVDDWRRFPFRMVTASPDPVFFSPATTRPEALQYVVAEEDGREVQRSLDEFMSETGSTAFIALRGDELLYEEYYNGSSREATQTSFSVAKSFASTLLGIAIEEGHVGSVEDPVTEYIPELLDEDERYGDITLRHLVSMSSGLKYRELGLPWSDDSKTYYAPDLRESALSVPVVKKPGEEFLYNNYNPLLLGIVLERATGMTVAEYLETRLWQPMGAEASGSWSLDSEDSSFEKMESGINGRAMDFARFGWLFAHEGRNQDHQVVPEQWIRDATRLDTKTDPAEEYQYFWWVDPERETFYARGNHGQYIYVDPREDIVLVRMGREYGYDDWHGLLAELSDRIAAES